MRERLKWVLGRQGTGYSKLLLWQGKCWDAYLMKYPEGSYLPAHTDPVPGKRHWRFNLVVWKCKQGGEFKCEEHAIIWRWPGRAVLFCPDQGFHSLSKVEQGTRYVFSIGVALHRKC